MCDVGKKKGRENEKENYRRQGECKWKIELGPIAKMDSVPDGRELLFLLDILQNKMKRKNRHGKRKRGFPRVVNRKNDKIDIRELAGISNLMSSMRIRLKFTWLFLHNFVVSECKNQKLKMK